MTTIGDGGPSDSTQQRICQSICQSELAQVNYSKLNSTSRTFRFSFSLPRKKRTDRQPCCVLEVFGDCYARQHVDDNECFARLSYRRGVRPSVCPSPSAALLKRSGYDYELYTVGCHKDSIFLRQNFVPLGEGLLSNEGVKKYSLKIVILPPLARLA